MSKIVKQMLGESIGDRSTAEELPVIEATRPTTYLVCPHCKQEIFEKHTYIDGDIRGEHVTRHSDCGGAIKFPPPDPATIPDWLKPYMPP